MGEGQARLDACMRRDMEHARTIPRARNGRGLQASVSREAVLNAVASEGREVMTKAGRGYWRDMRRRYPWLNAGGCDGDDGSDAAGTVNRFGRVGYRARWDGKLGRLVRERREGGRWVEVGGSGK